MKKLRVRVSESSTVIGPSDESGLLIMILVPAHPFLSIPPTLVLTNDTSKVCRGLLWFQQET